MYYIVNSVTDSRNLILVLCLLTVVIHCIKIIPERSSVTYVNDVYFSDVALTVRRNGKRGDYIANLDLNAKYAVGNNVTIDVIFYEFLHNEYRRSFVELHYRACDLILKDAYLGLIIRKAGLVTCPIPVGKLSLKNVTFDIDLPSVWPFEKGKGEMIVTHTAKKEMMVRGEIVLTFKQR
ncbi:hypothetical protein HW555_000606 [Spodoptera exigua]|uniref:Uncharacterized protein n=1 Tax=Spodoptera exigua TaxID=7107 RepID=A0A835GUB3_SPOEX|nr:hypothetical protein HW555_000606 [Spodoptera exigua]